MSPDSRTWLPSLAAVIALVFLAVGSPNRPGHQETPAAAGHSAPPAQLSLDDPASPWVLVNKQRPLAPADYVPSDLVQPNVRMAVQSEEALVNSATAAAAEAMFTAAAHDGVAMTLASGYRSYLTQAATFDGHVATLGQEEADHASARPGHSEHQTGWAFDIGDGSGACSFEPCFADQPAAVWAAANAHRFGFVVRYPMGTHAITGYFYEPWHLRFIGVQAATDIAARGVTMDEYFGLASPG